MRCRPIVWFHLFDISSFLWLCCVRWLLRLVNNRNGSLIIAKNMCGIAQNCSVCLKNDTKLIKLLEQSTSDNVKWSLKLSACIPDVVSNTRPNYLLKLHTLL